MCYPKAKVQRVLWWERQKRFYCCQNQGTIVGEYRFAIFSSFPFSFFLSLSNITIVKMKEWKKKGRKKIMQQNLQIALLGPVSKKPALPLFGAWSLLLIHVWISPNEGYGAFETSCPLLKWARRPWIFMHSVLAFWPSIYITLFSSYQPFHLNK